MKNHTVLRTGQIRKYNAYLLKEARRTNYPILKQMIMRRKINSAEIGQTVQRG